MSWVYLAIAIVSEVIGTTNMKLSEGFTKTIPSILIFIFYGISFTMLTFALKKLDISVAYAIWSGVGTALVVIIGILWFKEPMTVIKIASVGLIILGVIGLEMGSPVRQ